MRKYDYWRGKHHSEETKKKISASKKGFKMSEDAKKKISATLKGKVFSEETRRKISLAKTGKPRPDMMGENSPFWKGGSTFKRQIFMGTLEYKEWRRKIFERDEFTCQECFRKSKSGEKIYLEAHHIKPYSKYPELRLELSNGITLCKECHKKTKGDNQYKTRM